MYMLTGKAALDTSRGPTDRVGTPHSLALYCDHAYCRSSCAALPKVTGSRGADINQYSYHAVVYLCIHSTWLWAV